MERNNHNYPYKLNKIANFCIHVSEWKSVYSSIRGFVTLIVVANAPLFKAWIKNHCCWCFKPKIHGIYLHRLWFCDSIRMSIFPSLWIFTLRSLHHGRLSSLRFCNWLLRRKRSDRGWSAFTFNTEPCITPFFSTSQLLSCHHDGNRFVTRKRSTNKNPNNLMQLLLLLPLQFPTWLSTRTISKEFQTIS